MSAARRWADALEGWAIPDEILAVAPEPPWFFPTALFTAPEQPPDTPSRRRALEALPEGGSVLDVGAGAGAASLALVPPAAHITAVDRSPDMLAAFSDAAGARGVTADIVVGGWPDVAGTVPSADVVVCHHVLYNVEDLVPFVSALGAHARRRVVCELTAVHPTTGLNGLWRHFWGLERPAGPTADDAVAVLREAGIEPGVERHARPPRTAEAHGAHLVPFVRRRLCLPAERDPEIEAFMGDDFSFPPSEAVTLWW